ncbi:MAG TPA: hypothetical protein VND96_16945 [Candidatus Micrarchaeaceae archaeon]|nr:hypothetical protein [Candidatus Micrarchaeaceae archaeon]
MAVVAALLAALVLAAMGAVPIKTLRVPAAAPAQHIFAGQPGAAGFGSAWNYNTQHTGTQTIEGPASTTLSPSASFREPGSRRGGPQS